MTVITDRARAGSLHGEWSELVDRSPRPSVFLTPEWMLAWWDAYAGDLQMYLLEVRHRDRLVGVFPLAYRTGTLPMIQGWSNDYTDRFGPVVDAEAREAVETAARHLAGEAPRWHRLDLRPLSSADPATGWLTDALSAVGVGVGTTEWWRSPIVDLPGDPGTLRAGLGGSFRSTLRRKARRATAEGLDVEIRTDAAALDAALAVSAESWAHREGTGIGSTPANERFYRSLASAAEARGWLRIALLRGRDGEAVAYELNLVRGGDAVNLKLGYRESAADLSPGLVLRDRVMDALIAENAATFDLLGTAEPYKLHWAGRTVPHMRLRGFPPTAAGRLAHGYRHRFRPAAGRALRWVRRGRRDAG